MNRVSRTPGIGHIRRTAKPEGHTREDSQFDTLPFSGFKFAGILAVQRAFRSQALIAGIDHDQLYPKLKDCFHEVESRS
jgi:hypothetical protein